jgi:hypothetical protein
MNFSLSTCRLPDCALATLDAAAVSFGMHGASCL